ncbi:MAG TPA: hypothetical protein VK152_07495 [Paludibacter sp.]|nr:hypothetical protein [Paludibacter sp.]
MENKKQFDMLASLREIEVSIYRIFDALPRERTFPEFQKDPKVQKTVQCNIEIIDGAMDKLLEENPEIPITDYRKIIYHRKKIFSGGEAAYGCISDDIMWLIVNRYLPILKEEVKEFLK